MKKYNVILFGGSNSILKNGLCKGFEQMGASVKNVALGGTDSMQNLYELIRLKSTQELLSADLIICESNINERTQYDNLEILYKKINWLYKELSLLGKKVVILILPHLIFKTKKIINNIHKKLALRYAFNIIDFQLLYEQKDLLKFANSIDNAHQLDVIMRELAKNIINSFSDFYISNFKSKNTNPNFVILSPSAMNNLLQTQLKSKIESYEIPVGRSLSNSLFSEKTYRINEKVQLTFPKQYYGCILLGVHVWNSGVIELDNSKDWELKNNITTCLKIYGQKTQQLLIFPYMNTFQNTFLQITDDMKIALDLNHINQEYDLNYCDIINFFLVSPNKNFHEEIIDFEALANENIQIPKEYDFNHLIPPVELYKEIIDEYCAIMDPRKLAPLQKQITDLTNERNSLHNEKTQLQNELNSIPTKKANLEVLNLEQDLINKKLQSKKLAKEIGVKLDVLMPKITLISANSAKARIHSHLSYKLGSALIANSKSILGYIRMPFILMAISIAHKEQNKNLKLAKDKLPPLESYADYQEALKEKECFTYKLGKAFIKAHKNWYGGGVYQILLPRCA